MKNSTLQFFCLTSLLILPFRILAEYWGVPDNKNSVVSPLKFDESTRKNGAILFNKHCLSCHGEPTKNNSVLLSPQPGDPASAKFVEQNDGSLFYKITNGRGLMPKFGSVLKEKERWEIISYIRSFHKGYVQPDIPVSIGGDKKALMIKIAKLNDSAIEATALSYLNDTMTIPEANVELALMVNRYFGKLSLGEPSLTSLNGKVVFKVDSSLPADTVGNNTFIVTPTNKQLYGDIEAVELLALGAKNDAPALNEKRAIWNVVKKAPLWIIFTYSLGVLAVWSVLGYIIYQLFKLGKKPANYDLTK